MADEEIKLGDVGKMQEAYAPKIEKKVNWKLIILSAAAIIAVIFGIFGAAKGLDEHNALQNAEEISIAKQKNQDPPPEYEPRMGFTNPLGSVDFLIIALLGSIGPIGFYLNHEQNKIKDIETRLPEFLRDIAESGRFGMTLAASIQAAAKGKYGPLTPEIQRMSFQISWGISATEAIRLLQDRLETPLANRVLGIVIKAANAGGNVSDVLTLVSNDVKDQQFTESERRVEMITYIVVIYVAFFVFIATVLILNFIFIPQMESVIKQGQGQTSGEELGGGEVGGVSTQGLTTESIQEIKNLYLAAAIIHGLGDGVVAGILDTGRIANGMRHSFLMVMIAYIGLRFAVM
jgi:flagellar protein FlaJ